MPKPRDLRPPDEDGYELWLRYRPVASAVRLAEYRSRIQAVVGVAHDATLGAALEELERGLTGLLGSPFEASSGVGRNSSLLVSTPGDAALLGELGQSPRLARVGQEGFVLTSIEREGAHHCVLAANTSVGVLYGAFHLLRLLQTESDISRLDIESKPRIALRLLNHWDNLDGTVERGYAGFSLWDWHKLPGYVDPRYRDYARACASIGLNGSVLTNVNANALLLSEPYLDKVAALADVFRAYGSASISRRASARLRSSTGWRARIRWTRACESGGSARWTPSISAFRISVASPSRPTPRGSRGHKTTGAATPRARTCSPARSAAAAS